MYRSISLVSGPTQEPVSLDESKLHLRIDDEDQDQLVSQMIQAARDTVEEVTHRALVGRTVDVGFDSFNHTIELPLAPLRTVQSVKYLDTNGDQQTLDSDYYQVDSSRCPGIISLSPQYSWPATYGTPGQIVIQIDCGYASRELIPSSLRHCVLLKLEELFDGDSRVFSSGTNSKSRNAVQVAFDSLIQPWVVRYL
jgi:uncharacterized phiE125 gp8 family phage protein